jgi:hypothetical protein
MAVCPLQEAATVFAVAFSFSLSPATVTPPQSQIDRIERLRAKCVYLILALDDERQRRDMTRPTFQRAMVEYRKQAAWR